MNTGLLTYLLKQKPTKMILGLVTLTISTGLTSIITISPCLGVNAKVNLLPSDFYIPLSNNLSVEKSLNIETLEKETLISGKARRRARRERRARRRENRRIRREDRFNRRMCRRYGDC